MENRAEAESNSTQQMLPGKHSPRAPVYNPSSSPGFVGHFAIHLWRQEKEKIDSLKRSTEILP